jgi:hypothetical protein
MPNVSVDSCIMIFHDEQPDGEDNLDVLTADYLYRREMAERAAAKRSSQPLARAAHQELAQLYAARRTRSGSTPA